MLENLFLTYTRFISYYVVLIMRVILWFSLVSVVAFYITGSILDPDLWWHIVVGRWISFHQELPTTEQWNMYAQGKPWTAYSWLIEILFSSVDSNFGHRGLLVLKLTLSLIFSSSLFYVFGKISKNWFFGSFLGVISTLACFSHFTLRPQSFVWVIFVWLVYVAYKIREEGLGIKKILLTLLLMSLWANSHLTSILGLAALFAFTYIDGDLFSALKVSIIGFLGTLITPNFGKEWLTFFKKASHPFNYDIIAEFKPGNIFDYSTVFLILLLILLIVFLYHQPRKIHPLRFLICGVFCLGAFAVVKFLPFAFILCGCILSEFWQKGGSDERAYGNLSESFHKLIDLVKSVPVQGLTFVFLCIAVVQVFQIWQNPLSYSRVPVEAVDYIEQNDLKPPILNTFTHGGYLMYRFSDEKGELKNLVALDGRTNVNDPKIWKMFVSAYTGKEDWKDIINEVKPNTIIWNRESPLNALLEIDGEWKRVFQSGAKDFGLVVFVRS